MSTTDRAADDYDFQLVRLDGQCRDILKTIHEKGGTATSKELKADAGVDKNQLHYRLDDVLADMGLVETYTATPEGGGKKLKHASFTEKGQQAVDAGLCDDILDANTGLRQLQRELDEVADRLDSKVDRRKLAFATEELRADIGSLEDDIREIDASADVERLESTVSDIDETLSSLRETADALENDIATVDDEKADADRVNELSAAVDDRLADLDAEIDAADRTENLVALSRVVRELADRLDDQDRRDKVRRLSYSVQELSETAATTDVVDSLRDDLDTLEEQTDQLAAERSVRTLRERIERLERSVDGLGLQLAENTSALADHTEYTAKTREEKERHWAEQAKQRIAELDCGHIGLAHIPGIPSDRRQRRKLLAHLEDAELALIREESLFEPGDAVSAERSTKIPYRCKHGWLRSMLLPWR